MSEQTKIKEILGDMDELLNRVYVANSTYAKESPQVKRACDSLGGALMDLTARLTKLFSKPIGPQGIMLFEYDPAKPYNFKVFTEELKRFLCDKGASVIILDLERGVDKLMGAIR